MLSLETLDLLLAITEGEMIEEMIVGMLAAPQLSVFFKSFRPYGGRWIAICRAGSCS